MKARMCITRTRGDAMRAVTLVMIVVCVAQQPKGGQT